MNKSSIRPKTTETKNQFQNNDKMLIIDEVSTAITSQMEALSKQLRWLTNNPSNPFCSVDTVFVGDSIQLPPFGEK